LLEFSEAGFIKTEFVSRVLFLKSQGNVFGIKRLRRAITPQQSFALNTLADKFKKDFGIKKQMEEIYDFDVTEEDSEEEEGKENQPMGANPRFGTNKKTKYGQDAIAGVG
jgi:hypothetical protein